MDSGLAGYLVGFETALDLQASEYASSFLETYVVAELIKSYHNNGLRTDFTYLRNKETAEIDLLIEQNRTLHPFEIKKP